MEERTYNIKEFPTLQNKKDKIHKYKNSLSCKDIQPFLFMLRHLY